MTTNDNNQIVRWLVIIVLGVATAGMTAVSLRANYLFGYGFGQTPEKAQVFGWANVAADLWKVSGLIVITSLWRASQKRFALSLMPIWALCLLWGLAGAIGVYAQDRTALIGGRAGGCRDVQGCRARSRGNRCETERVDDTAKCLASRGGDCCGTCPTGYVGRARAWHCRKTVSELHEGEQTNGGSLS